MTSRLLPPSEWTRLVGTQLETVVPILPEGASVLVVEQDGGIVACAALYPLWHLEGLGITVKAATRPLLDLIRAQTAEIPGVVCWAQNPVVEPMLERLGAEWMPGKCYAWKP